MIEQVDPLVRFEPTMIEITLSRVEAQDCLRCDELDRGGFNITFVLCHHARRTKKLR